MEIPDHFTCLLRDKKQQLELNMEQQTCSKLGEEYVKALYYHSAYLTYLSTSCEMPGWETMETVKDFIVWGSRIIADGDCSHEIKRCLLLGRKAMTNLDSILKSRDITLMIKVHIVKAMIFPVVMYGCKSWTINKAEHWRIDAFKLECWRILLRVPWTARRSNQSILKEINPEYSLEGLMLKLKL